MQRWKWSGGFRKGKDTKVITLKMIVLRKGYAIRQVGEKVDEMGARGWMLLYELPLKQTNKHWGPISKPIGR